MRGQPGAMICALMLIALAAAGAGKAAQPSRPTAAVATAESYIEDRLKDPISARYRHMQTGPIYASDGHGARNVCGVVYAKNGRGVYDGGARFVVGLKDGHPVGVITDLDDNREGTAIFLQFGERICGTPFATLQSELEKKNAQELAADAAATAGFGACGEAMRSALAGAKGNSTATKAAIDGNLQCMHDVTAEHRAAYSRTLGFPWQGPFGVH